jgi:hypothetical protein
MGLSDIRRIKRREESVEQYLADKMQQLGKTRPEE